MIAISPLQPDHFVLDGPINFDNAVKLRQQGMALLTASSPTDIYIDLQKVTRVDNVALSLLLAWARDAKKINKKMHFINIPDVLNKMATVYGVHAILF